MSKTMRRKLEMEFRATGQAWLSVGRHCRIISFWAGKLSYIGIRGTCFTGENELQVTSPGGPHVYAEWMRWLWQWEEV